LLEYVVRSIEKRERTNYVDAGAPTAEREKEGARCATHRSPRKREKLNEVYIYM